MPGSQRLASFARTLSTKPASKLLSPGKIGDLELTSKVVMAPLTRSRSEPVTGVPTPFMVDYYSQRAGAGLIIAEGTQPSFAGQGYPRTPGIHTPDQVAAWRKITDAVKAKGGKMFLQIMHVGRIAHAHNRCVPEPPVAPSAIRAAGQMYTDQEGMLDFDMPRALETSEVQGVIEEHVQAAQCAMEAGFHGVEIHSANGYLLNQFLATGTNKRTDKYGGSVTGRVRMVAETVEAVAAAIGASRTGIRLSPGHMFNDLVDDDPMGTAVALLDALPTKDMAYVHLMLANAFDASLNNAGDAGQILPTLRPHAKGLLIAAGQLTKEGAEELLDKGVLDLAVFGRPFIANPDLVRRFKEGLPLAEPDPTKFYTPGPQGYSDYPAYKA